MLWKWWEFLENQLNTRSVFLKNPLNWRFGLLKKNIVVWNNSQYDLESQRGKMDASKLYKMQIFLTKLFGFSLEYQNDRTGNLMKFYAVFVLFSNIFTNTFMLHFIFFGSYEIEEFSETFASLIAAMETVVKIKIKFCCKKVKLTYWKMENLVNFMCIYKL